MKIASRALPNPSWANATVNSQKTNQPAPVNTDEAAAPLPFRPMWASVFKKARWLAKAGYNVNVRVLRLGTQAATGHRGTSMVQSNSDLIIALKAFSEST